MNRLSFPIYKNGGDQTSRLQQPSARRYPPSSARCRAGAAVATRKRVNASEWRNSVWVSWRCRLERLHGAVCRGFCLLGELASREHSRRRIAFGSGGVVSACWMMLLTNHRVPLLHTITQGRKRPRKKSVTDNRVRSLGYSATAIVINATCASG